MGMWQALRLAAGVALAAMALAAGGVHAQGRRLVIIDNDFSVAGGAMAVMPLIADPGVRLLGLTVVAGDSYVPDSTAHTLRFMELIGRGDIPVVEGANAPLVLTKTRERAWEKAYGKWPYRGAFADPEPGKPAPGPTDVSPMTEGPTALKPAPGTAATFLIDQVNRHPGAVSILAAGPLTNLALAIRLDPGFAGKVKQLVIMGGMVDNNQLQVTDDVDFYTDFNFMFDPEAADIVLGADFPKVVIVGNVSNTTRLTKAMVDRVAAKKTVLTDYYVRNGWVGLPLWDELAAAILDDPSLVTKSTEAYMGVDLDHGVNYGSAHVWAEANHPGLGERKVTIVDQVDMPRFYDSFVRALQMDVGKSLYATRPAAASRE